MEVQLDMYQTLAASVLVLMLGSYLKQQIHVLEKFCIPAQVEGGLIFAIDLARDEQTENILP